MEPITNITQLNTRIKQLEIEQLNEEVLLKAQFKLVKESLTAANLIKRTVNSVIATPHLKNNIVNTVLSYGTGYLAKKIVTGSTHNPIKKILGMVLQTSVTNAVANNADDIKSLLINLIKNKIKKNYLTNS